jgi:Xaa-Pro aminopeptidase
MLFGDTERSAALRHEIPITIIDSLLWVEIDGRTVVLTSQLEHARIARLLPDAEVLDFFAFGMRELRQQGLSYADAEREVVSQVVRHLGLATATVPGDFPVALADRLRGDGLELTIDDRIIEDRRRSKTERELDGIRTAQRAAEAGIAAAAAMLARAEPGPDGRLHLDGEELHAERVRAALRAACDDRGAPCPPDVTVASVWNGFGHEPGSGPLPAGLPIQVDLWPRDEDTACWADMTRTFIVGDPAPEHAELIAEQEQLVSAALGDAIAGARPGVTGRELYDATCDRFETAGYRTQRTGPGQDPSEGFQFSLGHGVGLEVHEAPSLGLGGHDPIVLGDVLAIEPGLWDRRVGGVRFEDLLLVTEDGPELLTRYAYELTP